MKRRLGQVFHSVMFIAAALLAVVFLVAMPAGAAPRAELVMDMRTGEVIHAENADTRLHPASLTKMMTLYIAFEAVEHGEIALDTMVTISRNAANEPPSKLGLKPGQKIQLRYLIRAAAVKSANDAATAIGEAIAGSESAFADRMNRTAAAMGMTRTHFVNAHGLTANGHLSTARDMTILGRQLFFDFPDYYHLFSRQTVDVPGKTLPNTNRRFLSAYRGADGIKTGYTNAAGFNLVATAERGSLRVIATMFGGTSTQARNDRVAALLDLGFRKLPAQVATVRPRTPGYAGAGAGATRVAAYVAAAPERSIRPRPRPTPEAPSEAVLLAVEAGIEATVERLAEAATTAATATAPATAEDADALVPVVAAADTAPPPRPSEDGLAPSVLSEIVDTVVDVVARDEAFAAPAAVLPAPAPVNPGIILDTVEVAAADVEPVEVVNRISTSGGRHWGINVGRFNTRDGADRMLIRTALSELASLGEALRKVVNGAKGFDANFVGLTEEGAELACRRLAARGTECTTFGPPS